MDGLGSSVEDVFISPNLHNSPSSALRIAYIIELLYRLTQTCSPESQSNICVFKSEKLCSTLKVG